MSMYKCPVCGELFSTSYKNCPFCEEDDLMMGRRAKKNVRRQGGHHRRNEPKAVGPILIVILLLLIALVVYLLAGDQLFGSKEPAGTEEPGISEPAGSDEGGAGTDEPAATEPITLDQSEKTLNVGESLTLIAAGGTGTYTWSSSDAGIATVENGAVKALAAGSAVITCTDGEKSAACTVTVQAGQVSVNKSDVSIAVGESFTLKATASGTVTFTSDNTAVAVVGADGVVSGMSKGNATITATCGGATASCIVRVVK